MQNGLRPGLRAFKGVGWNRALPAPFGFTKGIAPDGVNDYLSIPSFAGKSFYTSGTIEFWLNRTSSASQWHFFGTDSTGLVRGLYQTVSGTDVILNMAVPNPQGFSSSSASPSGKQHI